MLLIPLAGVLFATSAVAFPIATPKAVIVESRTSPPLAWTRSELPLDPQATFQLSIGLAQQNLHMLEAELHKVSDPNSASYGRHWSPKKVVDFFAPHEAASNDVENWLVSNGIRISRHTISPNRAWVKMNVTVLEAERLLNTHYSEFVHDKGHSTIACDSYSVPENIREHIDMISPTLHFDAPERTEGHMKRASIPGLSTSDTLEDILEDTTAPVDRLAAALVPVTPSEAAAPFSEASPAASRTNNSAELENCGQVSTPLCLKTLYGYADYQIIGNESNAYAIAEFFPQSYVASDLDGFFAEYNPALIGVRPTTFLIDGGFINDTFQSFGFNGESNLDVVIAMSQIYPLNVSLYQVGSAEKGGDFNNLLDAIDGEYCTYEGGDDPVQDPSYDHPDCGTVPRPSVISSSYAFNEGDLTPAYEQRQCNEFGKLGLMGTTILYSSGDFGVGGAGGTCYTEGTTEYSSYGTKFNPSFPSTCPFATGIGATQLKPGGTIYDPNPEKAIYEYITSGGGFSNVFPTPDMSRPVYLPETTCTDKCLPQYQKAAIKGYYANNNPPYDSSIYNNSQQTRGFPDFSANGAFYPVVVNGSDALLFGTSASSPLVGGMITLINDARLAVNKSTVGFINPAIYSEAFVPAFNDITEGSNPGCNGDGFNSTIGWDPVTGLGTPYVPKLMALFLALP
ncbi:hypothetical protein RQP46_011157 [Phenoliferia psychrophenolica]